MTAPYTSSGWRSCLIFSTLFKVWSSLRNLMLLNLRFWRGDLWDSGASAADIAAFEVDATLRFVGSGPTAGPGILVVVHGPRLRLAADALVALVQERVDGHVVRPHVVPHLRFCPVRHGRYLGGLVALLPGDYLRARPLGCLLPANARHPGVVAVQRLLEWFDLADLAAQVRGAGAHLLAITLYLLLDRELGLQDLHRQLVAPHDFFAELGGLLEDKARVDGEDGDLVGDLGDHVQKRHPLATAERGREGQALTVGLYSPLYYLPRVGALQ